MVYKEERVWVVGSENRGGTDREGGGSQVDGQQEKRGQLNRLPALVGGDKPTSQLMSVTLQVFPGDKGKVLHPHRTVALCSAPPP